MKKLGKIIGVIVLVLVLIQLIPVDRANKPVEAKDNFVEVKQTPEKIKVLLKNACYDCHSNETNYPNYAYVAPISWSVKQHINEGRTHLNFSEWMKFSKEARLSMLKNTVASLDNKTMPIQGYIVYHKEANLSDAERTLLSEFFKQILEEETKQN